jgi:integrase
MRYGVITGRVDRDPCADLRGALKPVKTKNHAGITAPPKVGELLRAIDGYQGQPSTAFALRIAPYVFARPGELRAAAWDEFELDSDGPVWRIPATRMKMVNSTLFRCHDRSSRCSSSCGRSPAPGIYSFRR